MLWLSAKIGMFLHRRKCDGNVYDLSYDDWKYFECEKCFGYWGWKIKNNKKQNK